MLIGFLLLGCCLLIPITSIFKFPGVEVPHTVAIMSDTSEFLCQGINLDGDVVLTAATCVEQNESYIILAGFHAIDGSLNRPTFRTHTELVFWLPQYQQGILEYDIALIFLNKTIPAAIASVAADPVTCGSLYNLKSCFLMFWDQLSSTRPAFGVHIIIQPGICSTFENFTGNQLTGRIFCGQAMIVLPNVVGAALNCDGKAVGMILKSTVHQSIGETHLVLINLRHIMVEVRRTEKAIAFLWNKNKTEIMENPWKAELKSTEPSTDQPMPVLHKKQRNGQERIFSFTASFIFPVLIFLL